MLINLKSEIDKNFYDTLNIVNKLKIRYYCICGTMLGLYRNGDLIPWDTDIDMVIVAKPDEYSLLINAMREKGFLGGFHRKFRPGMPVLKFHRKGGRKIEFSTPIKNSKGNYCIEWYKSEVPEIYRDLNYFQKFIHKFLKIFGRIPFQETQVGIKPCLHVYGFYKKALCLTLRILFSKVQLINNFLRKIAKINFLVGYYSKNLNPNNIAFVKYHGLDCAIPLNTEAVCNDFYGPDWKKPKGMKHYSDFYKDSLSQNFVKDQ